MVLLGGAAVAVAVVWGPRGPLYGATALVAFLALAVVTAMSVMWAVVPSLSYEEAGRTLAYLAVFAGAVAAARLAPRAGPRGDPGNPARRAGRHRLRARLAGLARRAGRDRAEQPPRPAVPVLERRGHHSRAGRARAALARRPPRGQPLGPGARLSRHGRRPARDPADAVARRARRGGGGRDHLAGRGAAAAAIAGRAGAAGGRRGRPRRLGAVEGRLRRHRAGRWPRRRAWPPSSGCCSC